MAEVVHSINSNQKKSEHGITLGYQELPSPSEPVFKGNDEPVPGRIPGAKPEWKISSGNGAVYSCTCGTVTHWAELPMMDILRGIPVTAKCCVVGLANPFPVKQQVETRPVALDGVERR